MAIGLGVAAVFVCHNVNVYGQVLAPYYNPQRIGLGPGMLQALVGNLVSPARGLLVFTPVILLLPLGMWRRIQSRERCLLDVLLIVAIVLHWACSSGFSHWWGGWSYGPRLFSDMLP